MHALKITKIGNSSGVVLPKDVLSDLNLEQGDQIFIVKSEDGYKIVPYDPDFEEQLAAAVEGERVYRNALRQLAK
ncbi:MAG TPA: AbrB/MazE/SpoVT family DNA-binding domain-containing protein [Magnetospirillaceae bacterium]|jgi:putative addiction module antidote